MGGSRPVLAAHVGNGIGHVNDALAEFTSRAVLNAVLEGGGYRRKHRAMEPCDWAAVTVDPAFKVLRGDRMVIVVLEIVLARPCHLYRRTDCLGNERRLG